MHDQSLWGFVAEQSEAGLSEKHQSLGRPALVADQQGALFGHRCANRSAEFRRNHSCGLLIADVTDCSRALPEKLFERPAEIIGMLVAQRKGDFFD